jgi:hypothetical protein
MPDDLPCSIDWVIIILFWHFFGAYLQLSKEGQVFLID